MKLSRIVSVSLGLVLGAAAVLVPAAPASATPALGVQLTMPANTTVGQTGLPGSLRIANNSTDGEIVQVFSIQVVPSCPASSFWPCAASDAGVYSIAPGAVGAAGTACAGINFTFSAADSQGRVIVTPTQPVVIAAQLACRVDFTFSVLRVPTFDANAMPGQQTFTLAEVDVDVTGPPAHPSIGAQVLVYGSTLSTVNRGLPALSGTASAGGPIGTAVSDTATLSGITAGAASPSGSVTFDLYGAGDTTCASPPVFTTTQPLVVAGTTSSPFTTVSAGTHRWRAAYSGDANYNPVATLCSDAAQTVVITGLATPSLTTQAAGPSTLGAGTLTDTATLTGLVNPTANGTVEFRLYGPGDATCSSPVFISSNRPITGGQATSVAFTPTSAGTYRWRALYSGDVNNNPVAGACNDANENLLVDRATPTISGAASSDVILGADTLADVATISGLVNPQPSTPVDFYLYGPNDATCAGTPVFVSNNIYSLLGGPVQSSSFSPTATGTYRWVAVYAGDANNSPVQTPCNAPNQTVVVSPALATPTLATQASGPTTIGSGSLTDTATLTGGSSPTGTVEFRLYGPGDATCSSPVFISSNRPITSGSATSAAFTPTQAGTYRWRAFYSGDANNTAVAGACNDANESTVVAKANPGISGTASPDITLGSGTLSDTATITGLVNPQPSTPVNFFLYGPNDATCAGTPVFTSNNIYSLLGGPVTSAVFTPTLAGTYRWVVVYAGDTNNASVATPCNATNQNVVVAPPMATPSLTTQASGDITIGSGTLTDTATLTGLVNPTANGTVEFWLYGPGDATCSSPVFISPNRPITGGQATSVAFTPSSAGTYRWRAFYSGDANNTAVAGACNDANESTGVAKANPNISGTASPDITLGSGTLSDTATITGLVNPQPSTPVNFFLYGPNDATCAGSPVFTSNNIYSLLGGPVTSAAFTPTQAGTYRWVVVYAGDTNNASVATPCNATNQNVVVTALATPTLATTASGDISIGSGSLTDVATLTGLVNPTANGTVEFRLYGPNDATCATPVFTSSNRPITGGQATSVAFTPSSAGTYRWRAFYSGDANNTAVAGACNDANESTGVAKANPNISGTASPTVTVGVGTLSDTAILTGVVLPDTGPGAAVVSFSLYGPGDTTCSTPIFTSSNRPITSGSATSAAFTPTQAGTYRWRAFYTGDTNNTAVATACNAANQSVSVTAATSLTTNASPGGPVGTTSLTDTATLTGGQSPTGTITFSLYGPNNPTCTGAAAFTDTKPVAGNGAYTSAGFTPTAPGAYRWVAAYGGDPTNQASAGACGDPNESALITQAAPSLTTTASAGGPVGTSLTDTAILTGGQSPTGSITFSLYGPDNTVCSGTPVFTSTRTVTGSSTQSAPFTPSAPGTYRWTATYSGDANNAGASGTCNAPGESATITADTVPPPPPVAPRCHGRLATIYGQSGRIVGTSATDIIMGSPGADTILSKGGSDLVCGGRGDDVIKGGSGPDALLGGPGADRLFGGRGGDVLLGGREQDLLVGGPGANTCTGGPGRDQARC